MRRDFEKYFQFRVMKSSVPEIFYDSGIFVSGPPARKWTLYAVKVSFLAFRQTEDKELECRRDEKVTE